ncbi:hypothetical protein HAX54_040465, partial [Datura stramonium]|nr:hypothetical protein [Datura stramonium]
VVFNEDTFPFSQTQPTHIPLFPPADISLDTFNIQLSQSGPIGEGTSSDAVQTPEVLCQGSEPESVLNDQLQDDQMCQSDHIAHK